MTEKQNAQDTAAANKALPVVVTVLAIVFGLLLGLTKAEDKKYSYKR